MLTETQFEEQKLTFRRSQTLVPWDWCHLMMNRKTTKTKSDHPEIGNGNDGDGDDDDNNDDGADDDDGSTLQSLAVIA